MAKRHALEEELQAAQSTIQTLGSRLDQSDLHMLARELDGVRQTYEAVSRDVEDRRAAVDSVKRDVEGISRDVSQVDDYVRDQDQLLADEPDGQWHATKAAERLAQLKVTRALCDSNCCRSCNAPRHSLSACSNTIGLIGLQ